MNRAGAGGETCGPAATGFERECLMKRFLMVGAAATALLAVALSGGHAQSPKVTSVSPERLKAGRRYAAADLAVVAFSGAYDGRNYHVGGTVKNVGNAEYTRTRSATGAFEGRKAQLF